MIRNNLMPRENHILSSRERKANRKHRSKNDRWNAARLKIKYQKETAMRIAFEEALKQ